MRIPFPVHFRLSHVVCFATVLAVIELYQGTSPTFAICAFLFIIVFGLTFNLAGGLSRPSGSYVFAYGILAVILGLVWKAVLGEPADSNLLQPELTMKIYLGSIVAMYGAVAVSRKLTTRRALLGNLVNDSNIQNATLGCLVTGVVVSVILALTEERGTGSALSALGQLNNFLPMALILGVIYENRRSGGRRTFNLPVVIAFSVILANGILGFSKQEMFMPFACWAVAAGSVGYRLSRLQVIGLAASLFFMVHFMVPYSQYGRNLGAGNSAKNVSISLDLLGDLEGVRTKYLETSTDQDHEEGYYTKPQGFMDRLEMISRDDSLFDLTERRGPLGPYPILMDFQNLIPRFIWPGKPMVNFGNFYAHEMGRLAPDDFTTGISFSPAGEAYHLGLWIGIFVWAPLLWILLFTIFDSLCGDTRVAPWGLLAAARFAHTAPEGMLGGMIWEIGYFSFAIIFAALAAAYVMPLLGTLIKGPERTTIRRIGPVRSIPGRARRLPAPETGQ